MSDNIRDAATQTIDFETEAPLIQYGDLGGATRGPAVERPSRRERRRKFWSPVLEKMRRAQENRAGSQTMTSPNHSVAGARNAASPANIARTGPEVVGRQARSGGQNSHPYSHGQERGPRGPVSSLRLQSQSWSNQTYPYQIPGPFYGYSSHHGSGAYQNSPSTFSPQHYSNAPQLHRPANGSFIPQTFDNLRVTAQNYPCLTRSSSFRTSIPAIQVSQFPDEPVQANDTVEDVSQSQVGRLAVSAEFDLMNMCPPTPSATGMKELSLEDLGTTIESSDGQPALPDPASSNSVPRSPAGDWDDETKVYQNPQDGMLTMQVVLGKDDVLELDKSTMERMELVKTLLEGKELFLVPPIRSQTWSPSSSSSNLSWPDCDTTVVGEPHELTAEVDGSSSELGLVPNGLAKGIESFLAHRSLSTGWV